MKVYVKQIHASLDLNTEVFQLVMEHINVAQKLVFPIRDYRARLQLNAQYMASTAEEFWDFYRIFNAYTILIGGVVLVSEKIYRIQKGNEEIEKLSSEELVATQEFKDYLNTEEFEQIMNDINGLGDTSTVANAYDEIRKLGSRLSDELFLKSVKNNIYYALGLTDKACKAVTAPLRIKNEWNERYLHLVIKENMRHVVIHFNGSEEEYELLDNWLGTPELKLATADDNDKAWVIESEEKYVDWFNGLRSRLESECSYQTIKEAISHLGAQEQEKYLKAIQEKITVISSGNSTSITATRKKVVAYLHQLLNMRKGHNPKHYQDFTLTDLHAGWNSAKSAYILSLYQ